MSLNLDFKVQKEQKVREIEDSLQNYLPKQKGYQKIIMLYRPLAAPAHRRAHLG